MTLVKGLQNKTLKLIACLGLLLGATAISTATSMILEQPKCPEELLK
ncbi:cyclic lactone autoinducer peptide [Clostridium sp. JNZ J1-5]|nr:cyclic lactone autoinducer peptide [Clostridium sp.]